MTINQCLEEYESEPLTQMNTVKEPKKGVESYVKISIDTLPERNENNSTLQKEVPLDTSLNSVMI